MVKRFSSFAVVAGVVFPSITPGMLGWSEEWECSGVSCGPGWSF